MASWSRTSQYPPEGYPAPQHPPAPSRVPYTQYPPLPPRPCSQYPQWDPYSIPYTTENAPALPPRPYSLPQQPEYAPVLPPRPNFSSHQQPGYTTATPQANNAVALPSRSRPLPPLSSYEMEISSTPQTHFQQPHSTPQVISPWHHVNISSPPPVVSARSTRPNSLHARPSDNTTSLSTSISYPSGTESDLLDADDIKLLEEGISAIPTPLRSPSCYAKLTVPIVIPQLSVRSRLLHVMPFTRVHAPIAYEEYGIPPKDFVRMIDTINVCIAASPPFQAMHAAAAGVGLVPEPFFIAMSMGIDALASAGTRTTRYFRLKRFLDKMNKEVWAPRGLEMRILKDPELVKDMLGFDESKLLAEMGQRSSEPYEGQEPELLSTRRYKLLGDSVQSLEFNVSPPENRGNIIDKISAKNQARKTARKKKKLFKRQRKHDTRMQRKKDNNEAMLSPEKTNTSFFLAEDRKTRSNAMEYDDSSTASSDSDEEDPTQSALGKARAKADATSRKVNARANEKLAANPSADKIAKIEREREKDLELIEKEWAKTMNAAEERREKRLEKRLKGNAKRAEKTGKRMQRMECIVIMNLNALDGTTTKETSY